ncbi:MULTISPECIES: hypothetical protein [unclassified Nocardioides]|uniref:hypothetical protein n=1 Tax=unclassified Nocardioides TaxID=2615069 RepID=UPI0012E3DC15|nr:MULTISPECIES: hypothetical protein [unclassified Nocardioides]
MKDALPGSTSGASIGVGLAKAALRLVGGADLADAIADLTGIDRKGIARLVRKQRARFESQQGHEYEWHGSIDEREAIEIELVRCFSEAARLRTTGGANVPLSALMGSEELADLIESFLRDPEWTGWSAQAPSYFNGLAEAVSQFVVDWYTQTTAGQSIATQAGVSQLLRGQRTIAEQLAQLTNQGDGLAPPSVAHEEMRPQTSLQGLNVTLCQDTPHDASAAQLRTLRRWTQWARWVLQHHGINVGTEGFHQLAAAKVMIGAEETSTIPDADTTTSTDEQEDSTPVGTTDSSASTTDEVAVLLGSDGSVTIDGRTVSSDEAANALLLGVSQKLGVQLNLARASLTYDPACTSVPRLQRLSNQALREAGHVGASTFDEVEGPSLYVRRDLEDKVLRELETRDLVVISGEAGTGKTSLLWGLANRLIGAGKNHDTYFIKASYLTAPDDGGQALVTVDNLTHAITERAAHAEASVLIDTADLLVNDESLFDNFMNLVEALRLAGTRVIITSRPSEAALIATGTDAPLTLSAYSLTPRVGQHESEFVRAVRSHALAYCRAPGETSELAEQLLTSAIRQQPLGEMAKLPLALRMLFELYAPSTVPVTISATTLYQRYWTDRVMTDRRTWTPKGHHVGHDLTGACLTLAAGMLRAGVPEVRLASAQILNFPQPVRQEDVDELCGRGVGSMTQQGAFRFFHQTFFEFAAALLLLDHEGGLTAAITRSNEKPDDYFLAAVVEQAWVLGWLRAERAAEASIAAQRELATPSTLLNSKRCILVLAQVPVPDELAAVLQERLADGGLSLARDYFKQIPRPGLPWQPIDTDLLTNLHSQSGNAGRDLVIDVLRRQTALDPAVGMTVTQAIAHASGRTFFDDEGIDRIEVRELVGALVRHEPLRTLELLDAFGAGKTFAKGSTRMARLFEAIAQDASVHSPSVAAWADDKTMNTTGRADTTVVPALARLQELAMRSNWTGETGARSLTRLEAILDQISSSGIASTSQVAWVWALVQHLTRIDAPELLLQVLDRMLTVNAPELHEQLHHGLLIAPLNQFAQIESRLAQVLIDGLPASRRSPATLEQRWADTVRRTLCRPDVEAEPLVTTAAQAAEGLPGTPAEELWLTRDHLLWPLLALANAGHTTTLGLLKRLTTGEFRLDEADERIIVQQGQTLNAARPGTQDVLKFLISRSAFVELFQLIDRIPDLPWNEDAAADLKDQLLQASSTGSWKERCRAMRLLVAAVQSRLVPAPPWARIRELTTAADANFRSELSFLIAGEAIRGTYPPDLAADMLAPWWNASPVDKHAPLRLNYIRLLAGTGNASTITAAVETAFHDPVDGGKVTELVGYLNPSADRAHISVDDKLGLIATVGRRLTVPGTPRSARRDVPAAWREVMGRVFHSASTPQLVSLVEAIPGLDDPFAIAVLRRLPARPAAALRAALATLRDLETTAPDVAIAVAAVMARMSTATLSTGWPQLYDDLVDSDPRHRVPGGDRN